MRTILEQVPVFRRSADSPTRPRIVTVSTCSQGCGGREKEAEVAGKFELYKDKRGEFRFRLKAGNGEIILVSEGYKDRSSAKNGIDSVRKNAGAPSRYAKKTTENGKHHFVLRAANNKIIGQSEVYESELNCDNGVKSVMSAVEGATVEDQTGQG
jgi:hypothetical protein